LDKEARWYTNNGRQGSFKNALKIAAREEQRLNILRKNAVGKTVPESQRGNGFWHTRMCFGIVVQLIILCMQMNLETKSAKLKRQMETETGT
jgi:hypothetical protein